MPLDKNIFFVPWIQKICPSGGGSRDNFEKKNVN